MLTVHKLRLNKNKYLDNNVLPIAARTFLTDVSVYYKALSSWTKIWKLP